MCVFISFAFNGFIVDLSRMPPHQNIMSLLEKQVGFYPYKNSKDFLLQFLFCVICKALTHDLPSSIMPHHLCAHMCSGAQYPLGG